MRGRTAQASTAASSSTLTTAAGEPTISELSGNSLPSVTSAPAPTSEFLPIFAPFNDGAHADQAVVTDRTAMQQGAVTDRAASPDCERKVGIGVHHRVFLNVAVGAMTIGSLSPRMTAPNQKPALRPTRTSPISVASGAIQLLSASSKLGAFPSIA